MGKVRETPRFKGRDTSPPEVLAELFPNLRYIWMMRRDKVRQAVSLSRGLQTLVWWKRKVADILDWLRIEHPVDLSFENRILQNQANELSEVWIRKYTNEKMRQERSKEAYSPFNNAT